ncbi:MAG: TetR/AcrR family transcriptional regulator [Deltaproteobacteria bacterium]|nr:TetR/AcrR family transcriptional regulator [Deltaproteobacteria bacterium]
MTASALGGTFVRAAMAGEIQSAGRLARHDNRRVQLLDAAARLFCERGFHATSMRDIAKAVDMLSGSIYYHFSSKQEMLLAVYAEGARRIGDLVDAAVERETEPWKRLEAASAAHLNALSVIHRDYAQVMIRTLPQEIDGISSQLRDIRRDYEAKFRTLIDLLPLSAEIDRHYLRLMLIGALNWSHVWYKPGGDKPEIVARAFIQTLRRRWEDQA